MDGFYDVHCHLIPEVDDGSESVAESLAALRQEYEEGIRYVICTPHIAPGEIAAADCQSRQFALLQKAVSKSDLAGGIELNIGNEIYGAAPCVQSLQDGLIHTLAAGHYVLIEFAPVETFRHIEKTFRSLLNSGYLPIAAHIERYECLRAKDALAELEELGVYFQVNTGTVTGSPFLRETRWVRKLLREERIHFLGTDSHGMHYRPPRMKEAAAWVEKHCNAEYAEKLLHKNPECILRDELI